MADSFTSGTLGTAVGVSSLALLGPALNTIPKEWRNFKPTKMKRNNYLSGHKPAHIPRMYRSNGYGKQTKNLVKGATNIMVGTALLGGIAGAVH